MDEATYVAWSRRGELRRGDLILAREAPVGGVGFVDGRHRVCLGQRTVMIRPNAAAVDSRFLFYLLRSPEPQSWMAIHSEGSTVKHLNVSDVRKVPLNYLPSVDEQRRISGVLGALDDLIGVNRMLIGDLEDSAAAVFGHIVDPERETAVLAEVADHLAGKYLAKAKYQEGGQYIVYGSNSVMGTHFEYLHRGPLSVLARIGSNCGALTFSENSAWINNNASAIRAKNPANAYLLHQALTRLDMDLHRAGSGQPFIRIESLMAANIPWLGPDTIEAASRKIGVLYKTMAELEVENHELAATRDDLLPLLMSGRVRVGEVLAA